MRRCTENQTRFPQSPPIAKDRVRVEPEMLNITVRWAGRSLQ
jgi:hypothetical protein